MVSGPSFTMRCRSKSKTLAMSLFRSWSMMLSFGVPFTGSSSVTKLISKVGGKIQTLIICMSLKSGTVPGVLSLDAPIALLPTPFLESYWNQACEVAPIFNELVDRVSLDAKFIQGCLSRTKKADIFTSRLLDIHSNHSLIEMNTISCSFPGFGRLVTELHQYVSLLRSHGDHLGLDSERVPKNTSNSQFADAMAKAWLEYNNLRLALPKELISKVRERAFVVAAVMAKKSLWFITDHFPSESEWNARLLIEQSSAVKCPSIAYQLAGTKKIQQELAKPGVLESYFLLLNFEVAVEACFNISVTTRPVGTTRPVDPRLLVRLTLLEPKISPFNSIPTGQAVTN
ncbi:hypothetical protein Bca101_071761 [Brassica carinata]